jgi:hypothetical protein
VPAGWSAVSSPSPCPHLNHAGAVIAHQCADLAIVFHVCGLSVTSKTGEVRGQHTQAPGPSYAVLAACKTSQFDI